MQNVQKMYNNGRPLDDDRPKICPEAKVAQDAFATARIASQAGRQYDTNTADQIMAAFGQYVGFTTQVQQALNCT